MSPRAAILAYTALSLVLTWPLALAIASDVPGDLGDSLLNMWILAWGAEHLPRLLTGAMSWQAFWNAGIFHPEPLALTFSEHLFGQTLQILPIYWLTSNVILCYNLLFISTFALSAFGTYLLVRDLTGNPAAAFVAGLVYGFLPYRIASVPHLQVMSSQWMPFALYGLNRFVTTGSHRALAGGTAALVMQNWSCGYYLLYFAAFVPLFAVHRMWTVGALRTLRTWLGLIAAAGATLLLTLPFLLPYRGAQLLFGFERTLGEVYYFSANIWSYLTASENVRLYGGMLRANPQNEQEAFLGFIPCLLAMVAVTFGLLKSDAHSALANSSGSTSRRIVTILLALAAASQFFALISVILFGGFEFSIAGITVRARTPVRLTLQFLVAFGVLLATSRRARVEAVRVARSPIAMFALMTFLAVWLSFGPNFGVYGMLYEYVPGFNGVRVPARYAMIAGLFLAVLAGYGFAALRWGRERGLTPSGNTPRGLTPTRGLLAVVSVLILIEGAAIPMEINRTWAQNEAEPPARVFAAGQAPPVYARVASLPEGTAITEFPFGDFAWEMRYVYYSHAHWKPITNGYSGAFPPSYKAMVARLRKVDVDPEAAWRALVDSGSSHAIVHPSAFANPAHSATVEAWLRAHGATELERFPDGDILFKLKT